MTTEIEFSSKAEADDYRDRYSEHLCSDDDARMKTVTFSISAPEWLLEQAEADVLAEQGRRQGGFGQVPLTEAEIEAIDFSKGRASVPHAQAAKAALTKQGIDDWLAHYDPTLTVDEHVSSVGPGAEGRIEPELLGVGQGAPGGGPDIRESDPDDPDVMRSRGRSAGRAVESRCDHAHDHCEHGDPDACEFLKEACGFSDDQVAAILDDETVDPSIGEFPGPVYGALERAWTGFRAGLGEAKRWAAAINEIRRQYGQEPLAFEELGNRAITRDNLES